MSEQVAAQQAAVTPADLEHAWDVVSRYLPPTPLIRLYTDDDVPVYVKLETAQPMGSFKVRGALAASSVYGARGQSIITASAGNHALGVSYAAEVLGIDATVIVPRTGSPAKISVLRERPITLVLEGDTYDEAEAIAKERAVGDLRYVSAYNDPFVIAGQSTVVAEIDAQLDGDYTIVVGVGGGGLLSGVALGAARSTRDITVVGVESDQCRAVSSAVAAGHVVPVIVGESIADGLLGNIEPSTITPAIAAEAGVTFLHVDEASIRRAVRELAVGAGVVAEGSAAAGLAALRSGTITSDKPIVLVVSGRNIAAALLSEILVES
jgi:threonine dehydratase